MGDHWINHVNTNPLECSVISGIENTNAFQPVRCKIVYDTGDIILTITNFNSFSSTKDIEFFFKHDHQTADLSASSYSVQFYIWADQAAHDYQYSGQTTQGHLQYFTETQVSNVPALVSEVGTLSPGSAGQIFTFLPDEKKLKLSFIVSLNAPLYGADGDISTLQLTFIQPIGNTVTVSGKMTPPEDTSTTSLYYNSPDWYDPTYVYSVTEESQLRWKEHIHSNGFVFNTAWDSAT